MTTTERLAGPRTMRVRHRNGELEPVDGTRIVAAIERCVVDLTEVDPLRVATRTISGLYDGATTAELDRLSIQTAADLIAEEPQYSRLAARLLAAYLDAEVTGQGITEFSGSIGAGHAQGLIGEHTALFVAEHAAELDALVDPAADHGFEYFGLRTVADRYLLRHPYTRLLIETPQYWLLRVACGLSRTVAEAAELYRLMSSLAYLPSSPTLFNSGTAHPQMSSCYLLDSPRDELESIYARYAQVARLSKFAGGIGIGFSRVRSRGALIRGTNGRSNGIVPWLRTLDASVAAVNQAAAGGWAARRARPNLRRRSRRPRRTGIDLLAELEHHGGGRPVLNGTLSGCRAHQVVVCRRRCRARRGQHRCEHRGGCRPGRPGQHR